MTISFPRHSISRERNSISRERDKKKLLMSSLGLRRECPLVVQYLADLQSVNGFLCCDNMHVCKLIALYTANAYSAEREMSASTGLYSLCGWL